VENDYKDANTKALLALKGGATALLLNIKNLPNREELRVLFNAVQMEWISVHFTLASNYLLTFFTRFTAYIKENNWDTSKIRGSIEIDFDLQSFTDLLTIRSFLPVFRIITFFSKNKSHHEEENTIVKELSRLLFDTNTALIEAEHFKITAKQMVNSMKWKTVLTDSFFGNIAKIRALRLLLQNVFKAYSLKEATPYIEAYIHPQNSVEDTNYNIIQANTQAMSAVIGGADLVSIVPSDNGKNPGGTPFSRRIARNTQHLLQLESYMNRVKDPAAGSYFIEEITDHLCVKSWEVFQALENERRAG